MWIGYDDVDRLISYPDAHNLSANVLGEVFGGAQAELRAGTRADLCVRNVQRPARYRLGARLHLRHGSETGAVTNSRYVDPSCATCTKVDILGA